MNAVTDASVWVDALVDGARRDAALRALDGVIPWAPQLIDAEVVSALSRLERAGEITRDEADAAISDWAAVGIERSNSDILLTEAWSLRHSTRSSDAFYVALARMLECPLITSDARLSRAPLGDLTITLVR